MKSPQRGYEFSYPFLISIVIISQLFISALIAIIGLQIVHAVASGNTHHTNSKATVLAVTDEKDEKTTETPTPAQTSSITTNTPNVPQVAASQPIPTPTPAPQPVTPYSITYSGVPTDLSAIGYSQAALRAQGIEIIGHSGAVPKRCSSGQMGTTYAQGLAIKTPYTYPACPDGGSPLYDAYRPAGYTCSVVYNRNAGNRLAILAHEVSHCVYFQKGQYRAFDIEYKKIRNVSTLNRSQLNEVIADDMMICKHGLDTGWGSGSYYSIYKISYPTAGECAAINTLISTYL